MMEPTLADFYLLKLANATFFLLQICFWLKNRLLYRIANLTFGIGTDLDFIHLKVRLRANLPVNIGVLQLRPRFYELAKQGLISPGFPRR